MLLLPLCFIRRTGMDLLYPNLFLHPQGCVAKGGRVKAHGLRIRTFVTTLQAIGNSCD